MIRGVGAVPETVGDAAIVASPEAGICELTEMLYLVLTNSELRSTLIDRGTEHLRFNFSNDTSGEFIRRINELAS